MERVSLIKRSSFTLVECQGLTSYPRKPILLKRSEPSIVHTFSARYRHVNTEPLQAKSCVE